MVAILVALTFLFFISLDAIMTKRHVIGARLRAFFHMPETDIRFVPDLGLVMADGGEKIKDEARK